MATTGSGTLLGAYIGVPDNSNPSNQAAVNAQYSSFVSAMGQAPSMMDTYVDMSLPESQWVADAQWEADSWKATSWAQNMIPVIGIPMASSGENADQSFRNIMSGSEDSVFNGIFQAWANDGYKTLYIRPGFEMNGTWMPWSVNASNASDYVAAFQHIAALAHKFAGANIQVVWNPNVGGTPVPMSQLYPGNSAVDIIGLDTYGAPINTDTSPTDTSTSPTDFTLTDAINMAKANGKPFALPETGGVDASFPQALASTVAQAGVNVAFMNLWDINDGSGNLSWSNASDNRAATAAAWKQAYQTIAANSVAGAPPVSAPTPAPTVTPSANDTVVLAGSNAAITDASGNQWTITSGGQVSVNGTVDAVTANVVELAYVNGTIWQKNSAGYWWGETQPNDAWAGQAGTTTSPLPATSSPTTTPTTTPAPTVTPSANDTVVLAGSNAAITDASGNQWTITSGGQVAVNGTVDAVTANVVELAYVNGTIWQKNSAGYWWGETQPNDAWAGQAGTTTSPLPATASPTTTPTTTPAPTVTPSANDTVVLAGSNAAITDASGNQWTITSGGQVAVNGTVDAVTANVVKLAYVNGTIWQENSAGYWWGETQPNDAWAGQAGTTTSPLPATSSPTSPSGTDTLAINVSEDYYKGDAQFIVKVNGTQVGGTMTAHTLHASGNGDVFDLTGHWGSGVQNVQIQFLNDAYGGSSSLDRNLYVNSVAYDGTTYAHTSATLLSAGSVGFSVGGSTPTASPPADTVTVQLSEDAYKGNANFVLTLDGKTITTPESVTALHSLGQMEAFTYSGNFGAGNHTLGVKFTNDAYGGSAALDRNLYVEGVTVNGSAFNSGTQALYSTGNTATYSFATAH